jgi:hypothetical protein
LAGCSAILTTSGSQIESEENMFNFKRGGILLAQGLLMNVAAAYFLFATEVATQHYYRGRLRRHEMLIPVMVAPLAGLTTLLRTLSNHPLVRTAHLVMTGAILMVGLLGTFYHVTANLRLYNARKPKPGSPRANEPGPPPNVEIAGYHLGRLLDTGAATQPWLCPPSLMGLAMFGAIGGLLVGVLTERKQGVLRLLGR